MKTVAHLINSRDPGGAEKVVLDLCTHANSDVKHIVFCFQDSWIARACVERNIECYQIPFQRVWSLKTLPIWAFMFGMFLVKNEIDILHTHLYGSALRGGLTTFLCGKEHITTLHDSISIEEKPSRIRPLKFYAKHGMITVAISQDVFDKHIEMFNQDNINNTHIIYNGVDEWKYGIISIADFRRIRKEIGAENKMVIFSAGRLDREKGFDVLIDAFYRFIPNPDVKLVIAGTGCQRKALEEQAKYDSRIVFLGQRNDIPNLLAASNLYVSPSRQEGLGISIIEAMAASLPVVATDVGGVGEVVMNDETGILVPSENPVQLAKGIAELLNSAEKRVTMGNHGKRVVAGKFSLDIMARNYHNLYMQ